MISLSPSKSSTFLIDLATLSISSCSKFDDISIFPLTFPLIWTTNSNVSVTIKSSSKVGQLSSISELFSKKLFHRVSHICETLWNNFFENSSEIEDSWPTFDEDLMVTDTFELVVQINGKVRGKIEISSNLEQDEIESVAKSIKNVDDLLGDKEIKKCIYVKEKLINFVI